MTVYKTSYLIGESKSGKPSDINLDNYDIGIFISGWEERCTAVTNISFKLDSTILIRFEQDKVKGYVKKYDDILKKHIIKNSTKANEITCSVGNYENSVQKITKIISDNFNTNRRPLKIFFDITCCPKYYFLNILAYCFRTGISSQILFLYAEGTYRKKGKRFTFTHGDWNPKVIPGYDGIVDPHKKRYFLVSIGFEGKQALRMISRYEPDRISLMIPNPGFNLEYTKEAESNSKLIINEYSIPDSQIIEAYAGDAVEAWKILDESKLHRPLDEEISYLCLGTKPHALALGLRALLYNEIKIIYNSPEKYEMNDALFNGNIWTYNIRDLSVL